MFLCLTAYIWPQSQLAFKWHISAPWTVNPAFHTLIRSPFIYHLYKLDYDIQDANFDFFADDSVLYCSASSGQQALYKLQSAFDVIQSRIYNLKLVLNVDKTKNMLFSGKKKMIKMYPLFRPYKVLWSN